MSPAKPEEVSQRKELNAAVRTLAKRDRSAAIAILARFKALTTPELAPNDVPAAFAAVLEALKQLEAGTP